MERIKRTQESKVSARSVGRHVAFQDDWMEEAITPVARLKKNPAFRKLIHAQLSDDDQDSAILNAPITRSVWHVLAFVLLYAAAKNKDLVIKQYNQSHPSTDPLTKEEMETLCSADWEKILLSPEFPQIELVIKVSHPDIFLTAVSQCTSLGDALLKQSKMRIIPDARFSQLEVTTEINMHHIWKRPLKTVTSRHPTISAIIDKNNSEASEESIYFQVPKESFEVYHLPEKEAPRGTLKEYGGILVKYGDRDGGYELYISTQCAMRDDSDDCYFSVEHETQLRNGIYRAFQGSEPAGSSIYGEEIIVKLKTIAQFDAEGCDIQQDQSVCVADGALLKQPKKPTIIIVNELILAEPEAVIEINFAQPPYRERLINKDTDRFHLALKTKENKLVFLETHRYSSQAAGQLFFDDDAPTRKIKSEAGAGGSLFLSRETGHYDYQVGYFSL